MKLNAQLRYGAAIGPGAGKKADPRNWPLRLGAGIDKALIERQCGCALTFKKGF